MTEAPKPALFSSTKVASMLGLSPSTILRAIRRGRLRPSGLTRGGFPRLELEQVQRLLASPPGSTARLLTSTEVAQQLGISRSTMARAVKAGKVRPSLITPGGHFRYEVRSVQGIAQSLGIATDAAAPETAPATPLPAPDLAASSARRTLSLGLAFRLLIIGVATTFALIPFLVMARG